MTRSQLLDNANRLDVRLCMRANRIARNNPALQFFRIVSRLGDGVFWYSLTATMPLLLGQRGPTAATHMLLTGGLGFLIYRQLKARLVHERPFVRLAGIQCFMPPVRLSASHWALAPICCFSRTASSNCNLGGG